MNSNNKITGIVLAGGKSSRMGKDKGCCTFKGKPMVLYAIEVLRQVCDDIIICTNSIQYEQFGYPVVKDEIKNIGPLGGIYSGLKASNNQINFILSCDMPLIPVELVNYILSQRKNFDVVIPVWNNFSEPMCAYYSKAIVGSLFNLINKGNYKIQDVILNLKHFMLEIDENLPFYKDDLFSNVNSPVDLNRLEKQ